MSNLDMYGFVDFDLESKPVGGVVLRTPSSGGYTGPGGRWVDSSPPVEVTLRDVNIQAVSLKSAELLSSQLGGVRVPSDLRLVHINDGTQIYPDDDGTFSHILLFSDGRAIREWRVIDSDNRPWRNFCKVIVARYRGSK